jgi:hypothetical protein
MKSSCANPKQLECLLTISPDQISLVAEKLLRPKALEIIPTLNV